MNVKEILRQILILLHLDLSRNLKYDRLTRRILKHHLKPDSNCIDIGCHKGEMLRLILQRSPAGVHHAFEPLPDFYGKLKADFPQVNVMPFALGNSEGFTSFQFVRNAPAYSGFRKRKYAVADPDIEEVQVEVRRLDDLITPGDVIHFIKIDVEGAEFEVMKGARRVISESKPLLIFEFGLGASDYYGTAPRELYDFVTGGCGLRIFKLQSFLTKASPMDGDEFERVYRTNTEYYFVACK